MPTRLPTFILVPGAYHRPSTWDSLRGELDALGYASHAVQLRTSGPDPHGDLHDDADAIRAAIRMNGGPVVVVAHSYGGLPMTEGAAGLPTVGHLVYVGAFLPDIGESMYSLRGIPKPDSVEGLFPPIEDPRTEFYADVPEDVASLAVSRMVDQLHRPFADAVVRAAWHSVPSTYIITENDNSLPVDVQERMATRAKNVRRIRSGHAPQLARPAELAVLLDEAARS